MVALHLHERLVKRRLIEGSGPLLQRGITRQPQERIEQCLLFRTSSMVSSLPAFCSRPPPSPATGGLPSCYIDVHSGCFVNQSQPCTDAEYKDFLRMCHDTYPASKGVGTKKKFKVQG
jgi:hypothetical protein